LLILTFALIYMLTAMASVNNISKLYDIYLQYPSIQTDSRRIKQGDIFFALKGPNFDGNSYAARALEDGAVYAVVDAPASTVDERFIVVEDVLTSLQQLARHHRLQTGIPFIAITGSNGKTTTKELITKVLSAKFKTYATEGNLNNHIGVPLTLLRVKPDAEMAVIEMGANHQKEIAAYCTIALPDYGLITNCGKAHLEGFGGIEGVRKAKGELYDHLRLHNGCIFRFADLEYLEKMAAGIEQQVTYGTGNAQIIGKALSGGLFLNVAVLTSGMECTIHTRLVGEYNLPNVLAAIAVGNYFGIDIDTIRVAIEDYIPSNSRSQLIEINNNKIIMDAYNANPASMKLAIENMASLEAENKWLLLGAMKEMGTASDEEHQALVNLLNQHGFSNVVLVGEEFRGTDHRFSWFPTAEAARDFLGQHLPSGAVILIKGSRGAKMELVLDAFRL